MNLLVLTPVYPNRGNETEGLFNEEQALAIKKLGVTPTVILCKPWLPTLLAKKWKRYQILAQLPQSENRDGIQVIYSRYLHIPKYKWLYFTVFSCALSILRAMKQYKFTRAFDLIQVHSAWPVGLAAPIVARKLKCPYVITLHIQDDPPVFSNFIGKRLYRRMISGAANVVTVGETLSNFLCSLMPDLRKNQIQVIPNGVDLEAIKLIRKEISSDQQGWGRIISVGNLWPLKGIDYNLRALALVEKSGISWQQYTIVGNGPERSRLESLTRELGISHKVRFTGKLSHSQVLREISKADIFSLPSYLEAFGVVYLEAMAFGKPVIGCQGQGAEEIIRHETDGLLVLPQNVQDLARAIGLLLEDPAFAQKLGMAGMLRARDFTWERNAAQYIDIYSQACSTAQNAD
jgi:glycosyltransferase involved in cell wall biosynthesis